LQANVDTDVITPMRRLTGGTSHRLDHYAFEAIRYVGGDGDVGAPDPAFPLNDPALAGSEIMLTGTNFGCGSSRETAPIALAMLGFRVLIGSTYGDIFFSNCFQQGILPISLGEDDIRRLAARPGELIEVDLVREEVTGPDGIQLRFDVNPLRKACLLEGTDLVGLTLARANEIDEFEQQHRSANAWIFDIEARA
jgi:3-isopropylmalate/(R)-2-methylmalate dehydratase small subunit